MRILNNETNRPLNSAMLFFTLQEAIELKDDLENMINNSKKIQHTHINDLDYIHEITVAIYDEENLDGFDERSKKLLQTNE